MAERECHYCGAQVASKVCSQCGAVQLTARTKAAPPVARPVEEVEDPAATQTSEQPWHPFEQPSWLDAAADPRALAPGGFRGGEGTDFMGVSRWETRLGATGDDERRRPWLLGALAAVAVVCVLAAVAFFVLRDQDTAAPGQAISPVPATTVTVPVSPDPTTEVLATSVEEVAAPTPTSASTEPTEPSTAPSEATPAPSTGAGPVDPLGGPQRDIACAPGFVVQIASAVDEAGFVARVAELRNANQLPSEAAVARTATSCAIFAGQRNSIVLYAGPFTGPYEGCQARLTSAPDSFIKGTTPETATQYVSCLCPAQVVAVPTIDTVGQTGVWVGELQRVLGNRLNIPILDLAGNWGTFTASTATAVAQFQATVGLPPVGVVDTATWQALQQAQC